MRGKTLIFAAVLELACVGSVHAGPFRLSRFRFAMGTLGSLSATPATISIRAANPDLVLVSGSSPGSLTWMVLGGAHSQNWTISVQAASSSLIGCPTIPISAVRVSCGTATVSGIGGTGSCSGSFPLSTTAQQIASGLEGDGTQSYSVSMNFTLAESWRYVANSACTITLTYTVNAP
jgi:hypothetical protein